MRKRCRNKCWRELLQLPYSHWFLLTLHFNKHKYFAFCLYCSVHSKPRYSLTRPICCCPSGFIPLSLPALFGVEKDQSESPLNDSRLQEPPSSSAFPALCQAHEEECRRNHRMNRPTPGVLPNGTDVHKMCKDEHIFSGTSTEKQM